MRELIFTYMRSRFGRVPIACKANAAQSSYGRSSAESFRFLFEKPSQASETPFVDILGTAMLGRNLVSGSAACSYWVRRRANQRDDMIVIDKVEFDTGRYALAPDFGLRIEMAHHSLTAPFTETDLRLYAIAGDTLRVVLDGLVVVGSGGDSDASCAGSFHSSQVSLAMSPARHHGYHDIIAVERTDTDNPSPDQNGECESHPGKPVTDVPAAL
ncbi:hypothetical protein [Mesorhizobium sp. M0228]|uniref:hypothetical protein n=1 Tax=Mesorhizobium sp. M0228 TaxID=2956923 RepID=UPI00333D7AFD